MQDLPKRIKCNAWKWVFFVSAVSLGVYTLPLLRPVNSFRGLTFNFTTADIHLQHALLGHTGEVIHTVDEYPDENASSLTTIALGLGITSTRLEGTTTANIPKKFPFFTSLLPSFCKTLSAGFSYHFYVAYDHTDKAFTSQELLKAFIQHFTDMIGDLCPSFIDTRINLHMIQCSHTKKPAWAQNDAMIQAYLDGIDYFYRINDDTQLMTSNWANIFIKALTDFKPPNVGVVGPRHSGGNTRILTYDFVHRTHVDIFGFYYPRVFTDWFADTWITNVYAPERMRKLSDVNVVHTMAIGQRYKHHQTKIFLSKKIEMGKTLIQRYVEAQKNINSQPQKTNTSKIISLSLYSKDPIYTFGAIRNAQLAPVVFPGWHLRIYTSFSENLTVPYQIIKTLERLGAEMVIVNSTSLQPYQWSYLVVDDNSVDAFIIRNARSRLSERDACAVNNWLLSSYPFHCIRDHPKHASKAIVEGLWGGRPKLLKPLLNASSIENLLHQSKINDNNYSFLQDTLWRLVKDHAFCHDSISCKKWPASQKFPVTRSEDGEYLSEEFDPNEQPLSEETGKLFVDTHCVVQEQTNSKNITQLVPTAASNASVIV